MVGVFRSHKKSQLSSTLRGNTKQATYSREAVESRGIWIETSLRVLPIRACTKGIASVTTEQANGDGYSILLRPLPFPSFLLHPRFLRNSCRRAQAAAEEAVQSGFLHFLFAFVRILVLWSHVKRCRARRGFQVSTAITELRQAADVSGGEWGLKVNQSQRDGKETRPSSRTHFSA